MEDLVQLENNKDMSKERIKVIEKEIARVKAEIVMGNYNGWNMTEDYKKKLIKLEQELFNLLTQ